MRVMQLIDSLNPGGAERVALTFANALVGKIEQSYLCTTRDEGLLKSALHDEVGYLFLRKKGTLDLAAVYRLKKYVKNKRIDIVHAHTTSYFIAALLKLIYPQVRVIWHEHQGNRVHTSRLQNIPLLLSSLFFTSILTVNTELEAWCKRKLWTKHVQYLPNFVVTDPISQPSQARKDVIICVANLKTPKNHLNLLKSFAIVHKQHSTWKLQLIGKNFQDSYSETLKTFIKEASLRDHVEILGSTNSVFVMMRAASIGVLASDNEGLPMVLLEYGASGLAVVATQVGHCEEVISTFGKTVPSNNKIALADALNYYIANKAEREKDAVAYTQHIAKNYGVEAVLPKLLNCYKKDHY